MGRKIPAKKHRGVKDPLVQQAKRLQSLKSKINAPPKDPDEQPVPRSLTRLFAFQERGSRDKKSYNKKHVKPLSHSRGENVGAAGTVGAVGDNPVSRMRRGAGEAARDFSLRINNAVRALHAPAHLLHYPGDMEAGDAKGERMAALRERRARKRLRRAPAPAGPAAPRPSKAQRLALKRKEKKLKAMERAGGAGGAGREVLYERVPFGETSAAPPALPRRGGAAARPGRRELLLTRLLPAGGGGGAGVGAEAERRERAREAAVAAYRANKAEKLKAKLALKGKRVQ